LTFTIICRFTASSMPFNCWERRIFAPSTPV
jgi:hypothetical protein